MLACKSLLSVRTGLEGFLGTKTLFQGVYGFGRSPNRKHIKMEVFGAFCVINSSRMKLDKSLRHGEASRHLKASLYTINGVYSFGSLPKP